MKRVALYVRVSTQEQKKHGLSVDSQIVALREYAKEHNYVEAGLYNDAGISARKKYTKRPALLQLIEDCKAGKIDLILFTKLDRWFRSVGDYYEVQRVLDDCKIPWRAIWEDYETETSSGIFKVNIMLSVAQSEADRTSERIKSTFAYKLSKGEYTGGSKATIGYSRNGTQFIRNDEEEEAVQAFFKTYLATFSRKAAMQAAEDCGLHLSGSKANRMLRHPSYYGDVPYMGCEPYITLEQHKLIVGSFKKASRTHEETGYQYIFSGLGVCALCGTRLCVHRGVKKRKDGTERHNIRLFCRKHESEHECPGSSISEPVLEKYLLDTIAEAMDEYNIEVMAKAKTHKSKAPALKQKLKRLRDLYELGDIELAEYKEKRIAILNELEKEKQEPTQIIRQLPSNWREVYETLDIPHKRAFWLRSINHFEIDCFQCKKPIIFF